MHTKTISRDQLKRLCEKLLEEAPNTLKQQDKSDPKMDKSSALLAMLYQKVIEKLGIEDDLGKTKTDFATYEVAFRTALNELIDTHAKEPFKHRPIINDFIKRGKKI